MTKMRDKASAIKEEVVEMEKIINNSPELFDCLAKFIIKAEIIDKETIMHIGIGLTSQTNTQLKEALKRMGCSEDEAFKKTLPISQISTSIFMPMSPRLQKIIFDRYLQLTHL